jgi:hypothetical protein
VSAAEQGVIAALEHRLTEAEMREQMAMAHAALLWDALQVFMAIEYTSPVQVSLELQAAKEAAHAVLSGGRP